MVYTVKTEMKCLECGQTDPTQFYKVGKYYRKTQCKSCFNEQQKQTFRDNRKKAIDLFGGKCEHCGYDKFDGALEFHHTDPSVKEDNWKNHFKQSWSKIEEGLRDTILLCANCHREEHERIRGHVAQLDSASDFYSEGCRFESCRAHQFCIPV